MPSPGPTPAAQGPERVGPYRLLRPLGRGGQATVWEALHEPSGRRVAVKRLHARALLLRPDSSARMRREVELLRGWSHPGVARLLDAGEADGIPFLVYELVPGAMPLDEACQRLPLVGRVRLVAEAARALAAVHARGVVHRDLTPRNLLVDQAGRVVLVDFGLARGADDPQLTRTGAALGTPGWLAPEVALEGSRAAAGPAADVWSLGALLYLALCNEPPFAGLGQLEVVQLLERKGPPSARARAPEVPAALEVVCQRALALRPQERYQGAGELADALAAALATLPAATPITPVPPLPLPPATPANLAGSSRRLSSSRGRLPVTPDPVPGQSWGRWEVLSSLGEGGMGRVFRVRDPALGREVALKVLPASSGERQLRRFLREAEAGTRVQHRGLARVHEVGEHEGRAYLLMELAEGEGLHDVLLRGPLPPRDAARLALDLSHALAALHAGGVLHRDVKPANIVLSPDGEARLLDLGVALLEDSDRLTRTHATVGTPLYMAPEQLAGRDVDLRADLWSLGAVLYEALTGTPPGGHTLSPAQLATVRGRLPAAPSTLRPGIDRGLDAICLRALSPDPQRRWSSAGELATELEGWLEGRRPARRRPLLVGLGAVSIAVVATAVWLTAGVRATTRAGSLGRALGERASQAPRLAEVELDPALLAALERADPGAAPVRAARAWVGLVRLARGDRAAAAQALELAGDEPGPATAALRGGLLALAGEDPVAALLELERAERAGLRAAEPLGWRVRALADRGLRDRKEANDALELLAAARMVQAAPPRDLRCLEAACHVALGDEARAETALADVADPPPALAWRVALLTGQQALRDGRPRSAREAFRGLTRPDGLEEPREEEAFAQVAQLLRAVLRRAESSPALGPLREVADLLELLAALAGPRPRPADLRDGLAKLLAGPTLQDAPPEAGALCAAAVEAFPGELPLLRAATERAESLGAAPECYARLAAAAGHGTGGGPAGRWLGAALQALALARAGAAEDARRAAQALLAELEGAQANGSLTAEQAREPRGRALLAAAIAERASGRADAALELLGRAAAAGEDVVPGLGAERLTTLTGAGRDQDAAREAAALVTQPERLGPRLQDSAELAWRLLETPAHQAARLRLAQELVARGKDAVGLWSLRLALLRARAGDPTGAKEALTAARERRFPAALDLPALLDALGRGEPAALEVLGEAEAAATAWRRAPWQERE